MPSDRRYDVACIGAGIVGLATCRALTRRFHCRVVLLEAEDELSRHQTGRNSGVLHSGLYYKPGSQKARNCVEGRRKMVRYCEANQIAHEICGKLVIATSTAEVERLNQLEQRGHANGLEGLVRLLGPSIADYEPHAVGTAALWVPETGIVDYSQVARTLAQELQEGGQELLLSHRLLAVRRRNEALHLETTGGDVSASFLVNCAGLESDRVARLAGQTPKLRIVPFRGDYFNLRSSRRHLLKNLIYPVPDPRFPFLGVHLTRRVDGSVEAGPNAVLALHRQGYRPPSFSWRDTWTSISYPGLWRLGARYWRIAVSELLRAGSQARFARALRSFVPDVRAEDLEPGGCGIRAQALDRQGQLLDDFALEQGERSLHVLNAPSPAATASLSIGETLAEMAGASFSLRPRPVN